MRSSAPRSLNGYTFFAKLFVTLAIVFAASSVSFGQFDRIEKDRARAMLSNIKKTIEKNYFDANFKGVNLDERFKAADEKLKESTSLGQAFGIIAQVLIDFNDSHTSFIPPARTTTVEYGWKSTVIGDKAFITAVKPGSDAEKKGLKVGDLILSVNGFKPSRKEMWKVTYYYYTISPRSAMTLVVQSPGAEPRELTVASKMKQQKRVMDLTSSLDIDEFLRSLDNESMRTTHRFKLVGNTIVWKMPSFTLQPQDVAEIMSNHVSRGTNLILDLRGNGGGYVKSLEKLVGYFFDKDVKIADIKARKAEEASVAKPAGSGAFRGQVVVLVDSQSASASELFARVMQLEKRGQVIGDNTSGSVMRSSFHTMEMGTDRIVIYGISVTNADMIMTDGKSLEHVGVIPDEVVIPTSEDLASGRDVALARAFEKLGGKVLPEDAGKFFPIEWDN